MRGTSEPGPGRRPRWLVPAVVTVVVAVVAGIALATARAGDDAEPTAETSNRLLDTGWWLVGATDGGTEVAVPTAGSQYLGLQFRGSAECAAADEAEGYCASGPQLVGSDACNGVSREIAVAGDTVRLGDGFGLHTAMACGDELSALLGAFFAADQFTYAIDADALRLRSLSGDVVLTYRAMDGPFGPTSSPVVDEGRSDAGAYRLVWDGGGLTVEVVEAGWAGRPGSASVATDPGRVNALRIQALGRQYLFGIVPAGTARVVYEPAGGTPEEVEVHDVGDAEFAVVGQFVAAAPDTWELVAYDASGRELHRLTWR